MKIILDTSVVMSAVMSSHGRVADILMNPVHPFKFLSCYFLTIELFKHKQKLLKYSHLDENDLLDSLYLTLRKIDFYNEALISSDSWNTAHELTRGVDEKDIAFVALSIELEAGLWTLDKKLSEHLKNCGYSKVYNTAEIADQGLRK